MKRALGAATIALVVLALQVAKAGATDSTPCPSPSASSGTRVTCPAAPAANPNQAAYDQLKTRLGGDIANALTAEQRLSATLDQFAGIETSLTAEVAQEEALISSLEAEIARLDAEIAETQARIEVEKQELAVMSRAIYRQPDSFWLLIARSGNLHEALIATADAVVAGQRAHTLQDRLEADLAKLQTDRDARQTDLDRDTNTRDLLVANLDSLQEVMGQQNIVSSQLATLVAQLMTAKNGLENLPPDVTSSLAQLLESQEQDLILRSYQTAWSQAEVGTGLAMVNHALPTGKTIAGLQLSWPMVGFQVTQGFGPTTFGLEPPLGPYKHFHTGIDLSAALGTPVTAAADGVVVAVGHSALGYGNYVVIAHGGGIATLYGHLLQTRTSVGQRVSRGDLIGLEGSTGYSTGPHLHFELRVNDQVLDPMPYLPVPGTSWTG
jgi:murein DD-endopeptidase MepM/ murein hydrolase activator NlpD